MKKIFLILCILYVQTSCITLEKKSSQDQIYSSDVELTKLKEIGKKDVNKRRNIFFQNTALNKNVRTLKEMNNESYLNETRQFLSLLEEQTFYEFLKTVPTIPKLIFTSASSFVSSILESTNKSPDSVIAKEFSSLSSIIDLWEIEFNDVLSIINWNDVKINFESIKNRIIYLHKDIGRMVDMKKEEMEFERKIFMQKYEVEYTESGSRLYMSMININEDFTVNLFRASQNSTSYYRSKVQKFMVGMMQLLIQAVHVEVVYSKLKYNNETLINILRSSWEEKFLLLQSQMISIDDDTKNHYKIQYEIDLDDLLLTRYSLTNEQFCEVAYNVFSKKYYWREWFVLVYAPVVGFKDHTVATCQGTYRFRKNGRNIIVSSIDNFQVAEAMSHISKNEFMIGKYTKWNSDSQYSRGWVSFMSEQLPSCQDADTRASVAWGSNVWFKYTRLVVYKKNCVNNKSPCYNNFLFA